MHCCSYYSNIYNLTKSQFSSFLERARSKLLGSLKQKCSWHDLMMSTLLVLNNFMKNLSTTKSNDIISDFFRGHASRPYIRIGIHLLNNYFLRCNSSNLTKYAICCAVKSAFGSIQRALKWSIYCTKYTPRYRISDTQGNLWPVKLVTAAQIINCIELTFANHMRCICCILLG